MADAEIRVGANATGVEKAMAVGLAAVKNFATEARSAIGSAVAGITSDLSNVVLAQGKVNFASQHQSVREFEAGSARMAVAVGRDLQSVRSEAEAAGAAIGKRPAEVIQWATEVGKLTGNFSGAMAGMKGISELAAATGRSAQEYRGLAVELQTVGRVSGDTSQAVGMLKQQADALGVSGGVATFAGQVEALGDTFSRFAVKGQEDFGHLTELAGKLGGGGANPQTAARIQQSVLGNISQNAFQWSRYLGRDVYDKEGNMEDPNKTVGDIVSKMERTYKRPDQARRALVLQFGVQEGSRLHNLYQSGQLYQSVSGGAQPVGGQPAPADALKQYLNTDAGKREQAEAQLAIASDKLLGSASLLGHAADSLQQFASGHPIASTVGANVAGGLVNGAVAAGGKTLASKMVVGTAKTTVGRVLGGLAMGTAGTVVGAAGALAGGAYAGYELAGGSEAIDQAYSQEQHAQDPAAQHSLVVSKEIRDRIRAARGFPTVAGGWTPPTDDTALARGAGSAEGQQALLGKLKSEGISDADAQRIGKAIAEALGKNLQVNVASTPDNPLTATVRTSQSSAAGNQGGT